MGNKESRLLQELNSVLATSEGFLETLREGLFVTDTRGRIVRANAALCNLTGFEREELLGAGWPYPFCPPECRPDFDGAIDQALKNERGETFEALHQRKQGGQFPAIVTVCGLENAENQVIGHLWLVHTLNDSLEARKRGDEPFVHTGRKYADLIKSYWLFAQLDDTLNAISDGIVSLDADWCYTYVNKNGAEILGREPESLLGKNMWVEFPEEGNAPFYQACHLAMETGQKQAIQNYYEPWGRWFENQIYPAANGITIYFKDITAQKRAETQVDHRGRIINVINDSITQPLFILRVEEVGQYQYVSVSKSYQKMVGLPEEKIIGNYLHEIIPEPSLSRILEKHRELIETGKPVQWEETVLFKSGKRTAIVTISPLLNQKGQCTYIVGLTHDITERKQAEELLIEKEAFLDSILKNIGDPVFVKDDQSRIVLVNDAFSAVFGLKRNEVIGQTLAERVPEEVGTTYMSIDQQVLTTGKENLNEESLTLPDKSTLILSTKKTRYVDKNGNRFLIGVIRDITAQKRTENSLKQRDRLLQVINDSLTQPLFILSVKEGTEFRFISVSQSFLNVLGIEEAAVIGKNVRDFIPEPSLSMVLKHYKDAIDQRKTIHWEEDTPYATGLKTGLVSVSPVFNEAGECTHLLGLVFDITERKQAEALLLDQKNFLDNIINNLREPLFVKDEHSRILLANNAYADFIGLPKEAILGKQLADKFKAAAFEKFISADKLVLETGVDQVSEDRISIIGGKEKVISSKKTRFVDTEGKRHLIGILSDITEQKEAELAIKTAKEYSEGLINSMNEGLVVFNTKTEIVDVNPAFCKMSGFTVEELLGRDCPYPFSPPEIAEESKMRHEEIARGADIAAFETVYMRKNGRRFNAQVTISKVLTPNGEVDFYFGTVVDATERIKAEQSLKAAKDFTDNLMMSMHEGLMISDPRGKLTYVNDAACKMLGYTREELIGLELPYPYATQESQEAIPEIVGELIDGKGPSFQLEYIRKNGERFPVYFSSGTIRDVNDQVVALFGTMKDISEEVRTQTMLEENARRSTEKKDVILHLASLVDRDFDFALTRITQLAAETLDVERVGVWRFSPDAGQITCEKLYLRSTGTFKGGRVLYKADNPDYFEALEAHQTLLIDDALSHKATLKFADHYLVPNGIQSMMDVFINSTNGYYGVICFEHVGQARRNWSAEDHEFATSLANIVSLMVESRERKIAEQQLLLSNKELSKANSELKELRTRLELENVYLRDELNLVFNFEDMVYGSAAFSQVLTDVEKVAATNATVLLLGESGTGKELLARAIHRIGLRNEKPLIKVNCSAIPRELIESELFGHKKGSFTGAVGDKIGKFELADGGTLFLDEIGELPLDMQPKLLRFLQEGEIEIIGGTGTKKLDVRVIAATNRKLKEEVDSKRFREDLYFRLNVFPIVVPPLRERREDVPLLVEHFIDKFDKKYNKEIRFVADAAMEKLIAYDWPGNIRELENLIERAVILTSGDTLVIPGFESEAQLAKTLPGAKNLSLDHVQRQHITSVLEQCNWKISGPGSASEMLELKPSTLRDKMSKLGIKR